MSITESPTLSRRNFCKAGIALTACILPLGVVPEIPTAVASAREAGYRMIFWTPKHTFIEASISDIRAEWGKLVFFGQSDIRQADTFAGACILRENAEIISSRTFAGTVWACAGDTIKCNAQINWPAEASVEQVVDAGSRVPRGRVVRRGFEPSVHAGKGPSLTRSDLELFFPDRFS